MFQMKHSPAQTYAAPVEEISPSCNNFFLKCELFHIYHFFNAAPNKVLTFQLIVGIIYFANLFAKVTFLTPWNVHLHVRISG